MGKLEELMQDEETREQIETELSDWAKQQGYKAPDEVEGLVKKKDELLQKVSRLNRETTSEEQRNILEAINELGIESADDIKQLVSDKAGKKSGESNEEYERRLKRLQKEAEQYKQNYESEHSKRLGYAKENAIVRALKEAGVKDNAFDLAYAYFDRIAEVEDGDNGATVIAKDSEGLGPPIEKYISEWAKSDAARDYIRKPVNKGAGVDGAPQQESGARVMTLDEFNRLEPKQQAEFMNNGGQLKDD